MTSLGYLNGPGMDVDSYELNGRPNVTNVNTCKYNICVNIWHQHLAAIQLYSYMIEIYIFVRDQNNMFMVVN